MTKIALFALLALPSVAADNPVEPLSNGLSLTMTGPEIKKKFGAPKPGFDARTLDYGGFKVQVGGQRLEIWHLTLTKGVKLASGIGPGSSRAAVERAFGAADDAVAGPYKLFFSYSGDAVRSIRIDPSGLGFAAAAPAAAEDASPGGSSLTGGWHGIGGTMGRITLKSDGTYSSPNGAKGTWKQDGGTVVFTGALSSWNEGRAKLNAARDRLEFYWLGKYGKNYFAFGKD